MYLVENKTVRVTKTGLFVVALLWFTFSVYQLYEILIGGIEVPFTDVPATFGLGLRTSASLIALITAALYASKSSFDSSRAIPYIKLVILFEAAYWLSFLPSGIWGLDYSTISFSREFFIIGTGLPCILEAIIMPASLTILFFQIHTKKSAQNTLKWLLITLAVYLFVFWFNYTAQWWSEIFVSGTNYILQSALYCFEFVLTVGGILFLFLYACIFAVSSVRNYGVAGINSWKAGAIITLFGVYFDLLIILWLLFPNAGDALTVWPTISIEHNPDLWMASLPLIGIPLMFYRFNKK